ncbi:hypothetical protein [Pokkaliibacter plantistimulans]|nr:hypothetical protein [Pokkaliibacter plantistimulans]
MNRQTGQEKSDDTPGIPHYASQAVLHHGPRVVLWVVGLRVVLLRVVVP